MDARLARLRTALDADGGVEPRAPATAAAVAAFEARHNIALPEGYRRFLLEVADGFDVEGAPAMYSLADVTAEVARAGADPAAAFGYSRAEAGELRAAIAAARSGGPLGSERVMALQKAGTPAGCLVIAATEGNDFAAIVVSGDQRGAMWRTGEVDLPDSAARYGAPGDAAADLDFLTWVELWAYDLFGIALGDRESDE